MQFAPLFFYLVRMKVQRKYYLVLFIVLSVVTVSACSSFKDRKPNVLFIAVDDLRPELGCYGKEYVRSPNIDKLASEGIVFANHYANVPTCGASRFTLLTGMLPRSPSDANNDALRKALSGMEEQERPESFIHHLRRNGYHTIGIGKISHYPDGLLYGYTDSVGHKRELPYSWDELVFDSGKWETGWNAFFGYADGSNRQSMKRQVKPYESADVADDGYPDGLTANLAIKKLRERKEFQKSHPDEPFFMGVGFFKPHLPFNSPKKYWDRYDDIDIPLSESPGIPSEISLASLHSSGEFNQYAMGEERASLDSSMSEEYSRKIRKAYVSAISYTDEQIGKLLNELKVLDMWDNTIVVVWGDHGWHLGDHRVWGKHSLFDYALRSALLIRVPGNGKSGEIVEEPVSAIDLYPTILELCGVEMPHQTDGKSLVPALNSPNKDFENEAFGYWKNGISLRTDQYRLTRYYRKQFPDVELFDYFADPFETKNIAAENPYIVDSLMVIWEKGNTGIYESNK